MQSRNPVRALLTIIMDVLVLVAIVDVARLIVVFFGELAKLGWAQAIIAFTDYLVIPFGVRPIPTPYGGNFEVNVALTIVGLMLVEWVLSIARSQA